MSLVAGNSLPSVNNFIMKLQNLFLSTGTLDNNDYKTTMASVILFRYILLRSRNFVNKNWTNRKVRESFLILWLQMNMGEGERLRDLIESALGVRWRRRRRIWFGRRKKLKVPWKVLAALKNIFFFYRFCHFRQRDNWGI